VFLLPDVLVLAGGGVVGESWMTGVLAGIEERAGVDFRAVESYVGTSAGAIVAATLASGRSPRRPQPASVDFLRPDANNSTLDDEGGRIGGLVRAAGSLAFAATAPLASAALAAGAPVGARVRAELLARAPSGGRRLDRLHAQVQRSGARFDGRLRICCVDRGSGRRVVFGAPGAPPAAVADAVVASCAIPWVFEAVEIGGREYVDGGVWSVTNLDAAPARRDTHVLCLDPTASLARDLRTGRGAAWGAFRLAAALEVQALRRRGAHVLHVGPDEGASAAMGENFMASGRTAAALAEGHRQGEELAKLA
jgi:NTE family protein